LDPIQQNKEVSFSWTDIEPTQGSEEYLESRIPKEICQVYLKFNGNCKYNQLCHRIHVKNIDKMIIEKG